MRRMTSDDPADLKDIAFGEDWFCDSDRIFVKVRLMFLHNYWICCNNPKVLLLCAKL